MWQWEECVSSSQKYTMLVERSLEIAAHSPAHLAPDTSPGTSPRALPRCKWATNAAHIHLPWHTPRLLDAAQAGLDHGTGAGLKLRLGSLHHTCVDRCNPKCGSWDDPGSRVKDKSIPPIAALPSQVLACSTCDPVRSPRRLRTHLSTLRLTLDYQVVFTFLNIRQKVNSAFHIALWIQPRVLPHLFGSTSCAQSRDFERSPSLLYMSAM